MADESYQSAELARDAGYYRSALSRDYYAAFQVTTAFFHYRNLSTPKVAGNSREAWSHLITPELLDQQLKPFVKNPRRRLELKEKLRALYRFRVGADYLSSHRIKDEDTIHAAKSANYLIKTVRRLIED